jgi:hypothetical protein
MRPGFVRRTIITSSEVRPYGRKMAKLHGRAPVRFRSMAPAANLTGLMADRFL